MSVPTVAADTKPVSIAVDPSVKFAYVTNSGSGNVSQYAIAADGSLTALTVATVAAGAAPFYVSVDPSAKYVYVSNQTGGSISQ